jgi:adenylosuccinate lyase
MPAFPSSTTVLDSVLFRDVFGTNVTRETFSDLSLISAYVAVEVALAKTEARCGREFPLTRCRLARQDRAGCHDHGLDRVRRGL